MKNQDNILAEFNKKTVLTLAQIMEIDGCSASTAYRYLKKWKAINSFNQNGRCYVLKDSPRFDAYGLWTFNDIRFSKYGNLTKTIIGLVENSEGGMNASEISVLVGYEVHSILKNLIAQESLMRLKKPGGYVYISSDQKLRETQEKYILDQETLLAEQLPLEKAVAVLVEKIKNPALEATELAALLHRRGTSIQANDISSFLSLHGLTKKK